MIKTPKNWREVGPLVFKREKSLREAKWQALIATGEIIREIDPESKSFWALVRSAQGDSTQLIEFLLSEEELSLSEDKRQHLAKVLKHAYWKPRRGRPKDSEARHAAMIAMHLYELWRYANKRLGFSDRGHCNEMKDESCRYALALIEFDHKKIRVTDSRAKFRNTNFEKVRELIERPLSRRGAARAIDRPK